MLKKRTQVQKSTSTTALATKETFSQEDVPSLLDKVNDRLRQLKGEEKETIRITEDLEPFGRISDITDVSELMGAYAYVTKKAEAIESYRSVFESNVPAIKIATTTINGHTVDKWQKEILTQHRTATYKQEIEKLQQVKNELESCLSEEHKLTAKLSNIAEILKS